MDARTTAGLGRLRKKPERKANSAKDGLAGAKARLILLTLSARLKPCPCYKAPRVESFRSLWRPAVQMHKNQSGTNAQKRQRRGRLAAPLELPPVRGLFVGVGCARFFFENGLRRCQSRRQQAEGRAGDVVEADPVAELDGLGIAAAGGPSLDFQTWETAKLDRPSPFSQ